MTLPTPPADDLDQLKRALAALKKAHARISSLEQSLSEPIAIVGIGCRLPGGANTPQAFWNNLRSGVDSVLDAPGDRWDVEKYQASGPDEPGKLLSSKAGFLHEIDQFDPHFFGISPREANAMDPQQRIALEVTWEALEDAGIVPAEISGSATGVFIGIGINDYGRLQIPAQAADPSLVDHFFLQGNTFCIIANRISYALDLQGPSMAIDSACSSSLVALHTACASLRSGDSDLALAGGSNLILSPHISVGLGKFLAPDGLCKAFDSRANGYTRGEGCIVMVLKRLSDALAAHDRVYALIRGSALNQDGFSSGLTVPNGVAQEAMLRKALKNAGLQPGDIDYVEAHGTGTALGDPIEANALGAVFAKGHPAGQELLVGSVKTNIGHLEAGAGIAGVLKTILALQHREIPPSLHYLNPNPMIDFPGLGLKVAAELTPWPTRAHPPRAGVSSFGFGGANAHAILEAAPETEPAEEPERSVHLLTLSARTPAALSDYALRMAGTLEEKTAPGIEAVCRTLNQRRTRFEHRLAVAGKDATELAHGLRAVAEGRTTSLGSRGQVQRSKPKIAFLFTGQGSQYPGMGAGLYQAYPVFREVIDRCEQLFRQDTGGSLVEVLFSESGDERIHHTRYTQPALFAVECALAALWRSWGVEPAAVLGHSIGEFAAAVCAGAISLEDGLKLVTARGRLMGDLPAGGVMAAVSAPVEAVRQEFDDAMVAIGAINGPENTVVSGPEEAVQTILDRLEKRGVKSRKLVVSHAFHSPLMDPILEEFEQAAKACKVAAPQIPLISNVTGQGFGQGEVPDAAYWRRHIRAGVNFAGGMDALQQIGADVFLEIGPNPVLLGMGKRCLPDVEETWLPSLRQGQDEALQMLKSLGGLYCLGQDVYWPEVEGDRRSHPPVSLPAYPFQHERYWFRLPENLPADHAAGKQTSRPSRPLLGERISSPLLEGAVFQIRVSLAELPYLNDHQAFGIGLFPATAFIDMALEAAAAFNPNQAWQLEDLTVREPLVLPGEGDLTLQVSITPAGDSEPKNVQIFSRSPDGGGAWTLHAVGLLTSAAQPGDGFTDLETARAACPEELSPADFYGTVRQMGMEYGPAFQNIRQLWRGTGQVLSRVRLAEDLDPTGYRVHPALLDACVQTLGAALPDSSELVLPLEFQRIQLWGEPGQEVWCRGLLKQGETAETYVGEITFYDLEERPISHIPGLRLKKAARRTLQALAQRAGRSPFKDWFYRMEWKPQALPGGQARPAPDKWLILASEAEGEALQELMPGSILAAWPEDAAKDPEAGPVASSRQIEELRRLLAQVHPDGIVAFGCDLPTALHLSQAVVELPAWPQVWLVSQGAQVVFGPEGGEEINFIQAGLPGFARSARLEYPDLRLYLVDMDPADLPQQNARSLWSEIKAQSGETEVAYRNDGRFVSRLARMVPTHPDKPQQRLEIASRGTFDGLALRPLQRTRPGPGEVEIEVRATGLNFRDVLAALDMYPGEAGLPGHECSGVVSAVGEGVTHLRAGDAVVAMAQGSFASHVLARSRFVQPKPTHLTFGQAATIPIAFLTADYALNVLGGLLAGEKVLIHAAAGGVGLAAVQLAQRAGAEIYATAGSPEKRALLGRMGVAHVFDSRSLSFADEIMRQTDGQGVQVVLNSLADEFIPKSLSVLQPGGRFLEIGKRGIWTAEQVSALGKDLQYHIIYLGEAAENDPELIGGRFEKLLGLFEEGLLGALPCRVFPFDQAGDAFRFMAQARHTGKIVLTQPGPALAPEIRPDAAYLITGGAGGIGFALAEHLAGMGARRLFLLGRRAPSEQVLEASERLRTGGGEPVSVTYLQADVSQKADLERCFAQIQREATLAGIVHAAGGLADGTLPQQTAERYRQVLAPKLEAVQYLADLSAGLGLDFFVICSAGAGWLGSAGQTGYAAANTAVDAAACALRARGLPASALAWGVWAEVGMAARLSGQDQERLAHLGLGLIHPEDGAAAFETILGLPGALAVMPVDWPRYAAAHPVLEPRFQDVVQESARQAAAVPQTASKAQSPAARLSEAPTSKRRILLQEHLCEQARAILGLSSSADLDTARPLREMGMDSLMAVELRNAIARSLEHKLPSTLLFDYPTVDALTGYISQELWPTQSAVSGTSPKTPPVHDLAAAQVQMLSEEQAEAELLAELDQLKTNGSNTGAK